MPRRDGLEQADELRPAGAPGDDDEPSLHRIRPPEPDGEPLPRGQLDQADQLGRLESLFGQGRLLHRLDRLAGEVLDQGAELGVVQEPERRRLLPDGPVCVEAVVFEVEEELVVPRHVTGQRVGPRRRFLRRATPGPIAAIANVNASPTARTSPAAPFLREETRSRSIVAPSRRISRIESGPAPAGGLLPIGALRYPSEAAGSTTNSAPSRESKGRRPSTNQAREMRNHEIRVDLRTSSPRSSAGAAGPWHRDRR